MRYTIVVIGLMTFLLLTFFVVEGMDVALLTKPEFLLERGGAAAALLGIALLVSDVFLPVPSSLVMLANGSLFGVWAGTLLSSLGGFTATMFAFWIGRKSNRVLDRLVSVEQQEAANRMLSKWGDIGLIASRPIPVVAETFALVAGTSPMSVRRAVVAAFVGSIPQALIYAILGARSTNLDGAMPVVGVAILVAFVYWALGKIFRIAEAKT